MNSDARAAMDEELRRSGFPRLAGLDEAGRGPLAGPVVAAAVVFRSGTVIPGVNDSKVLSPARREELFRRIMAEAESVGIGIVGEEVIDRVNILVATFRAMHEAVERLSVVPDLLLVDGNRFSSPGLPYRTVIGGDRRSFSIAAASIVAKVTRDGMMEEYDRIYPGYGFSRNKGYPTAEHRAALRRLGICPIHRRTFAPVREGVRDEAAS